MNYLKIYTEEIIPKSTFQDLLDEFERWNWIQTDITDAKGYEIKIYLELCAEITKRSKVLIPCNN